MRRNLVALLSLLMMALWTQTSAAGSISYTFEGHNDLSGSFSLDDSVPFIYSPEGEGILAVLSSPLNSIWGTYGDHSFVGTPTLFVLDQPAFSGGSEVLSPDYWILRASISGLPVNMKSPTNLNLFIFKSPAALVGASLTPPTHVPSSSWTDFQYTFAFSNGSVEAGPLSRVTQVTQVPEPPTAILMALALCGLVSLAKRTRRDTARSR